MVGSISAAYRTWLGRWRDAFSEKGFGTSLMTSVAFFIGAFYVNIYAIQFATERASNKVTDIVLSNIPIFDVDGLFVYATFAFTALSILLILPQPKRIHFVLKSVALFFVVRSIFTSLTHIAPDGNGSSDFGPTVNKIFFGADTFFSGHTGMPFLGALAFWRYPPIRYIYLAGSFFFAIIVLLGHLHYSIDVAAAFFITYGIFDIALRLFPRDKAWFYYDLVKKGV